MIIQRNNVDDYIYCPSLYAIKVTKSRQSTIKIKGMKNSIKKHLIEIASNEMKNDAKLSAQEYRTSFTEKYYRRASHLLKVDSLVRKLNSIFDIFANNAFVGYNVPVDIPLSGTSSKYRYIVDFILTDESNNITIVELEDLDSVRSHEQKLKNWPHYYAPYTYLAHQFDKRVDLIVIDPENLVRVSAKYEASRFITDYELLGSTLSPIENGVVYHNLFACDSCEFEEECQKIL